MRRWHGGEHGQVLVLSTLFMVVLLGMAAFVIDIGRLASNRRQLQNAADAGALAGALELPARPSDAEAVARTWTGKNGSAGGEVTEATAFTTTTATDTIRVRLARSVPYTFGRVLGLDAKTMTAKATVRVRTLNGITTGQERAFPYAVWDGNPS
jgi:uncharacterized membrane protein